MTTHMKTYSGVDTTNDPNLVVEVGDAHCKDIFHFSLSISNDWQEYGLYNFLKTLE